MIEVRKSTSVVTYLAIDELDIVRALGVAVTSSVFCTSFVGRIFGHTTVGVHLNEVDGSVKTAR